VEHVNEICCFHVWFKRVGGKQKFGSVIHITKCSICMSASEMSIPIYKIYIIGAYKCFTLFFYERANNGDRCNTFITTPESGQLFSAPL